MGRQLGKGPNAGTWCLVTLSEAIGAADDIVEMLEVLKRPNDGKPEATSGFNVDVSRSTRRQPGLIPSWTP